MEFEKTKLIELKAKFDSIINIEEKENIEFWYARDLQEFAQREIQLYLVG